MEKYVAVMKAEEKDLENKLRRLKYFLKSEKAKTLDSKKLDLMVEQSYVMQQYLTILQQRIFLEETK